MSFSAIQSFSALENSKQHGESGDRTRVSFASYENEVPAGPGSISRVKLICGALVFVVVTIGIFWYQFQRNQAGHEAPRWHELRWDYLLLMLLCLPLDTLAGSLRIWVVSRVLQPGISLWTCLKADWANIGLSMLTPSQTGGGFGQIYVLNRGGASVATAMTISLISFLGTMVGLFFVGLYFVVVSGIALKGSLFQGAVWTFTLISAWMVLGVVWPGSFRVVIAGISKAFCQMFGKEDAVKEWWPPFEAKTGPPMDRMGDLAGKLVDFVYNYHEDACRFLRMGKVSLVWVFLLSLVFMFSRCIMAFFCLRFLGVHDSNLGQVLELQLALIILIYFAPTPGASGLAEGASLSIMGSIVPFGFAPYYNLLWRCATLYLPGIAGLLCLSHTMVRDARKFARGR